MRRFGTPPKTGVKYTRRPGVYAIIVHGNDVLLTFQSGQFNEFQLPGGGVDPGEPPLRALHREIWEETGWSIRRPRKIGVFRRFTWMPEYEIHAEKICYVYMAHPARKLGPPPEPDHQPVWMPINEAADALYNWGDQHFVRLLASSAAKFKQNR